MPPTPGVAWVPLLDSGACKRHGFVFFIRVIRVIRGHFLLMKHEELTRDIIGAAMAVLYELKPGLDWKRVVRGKPEE